MNFIKSFALFVLLVFTACSSAQNSKENDNLTSKDPKPIQSISIATTFDQIKKLYTSSSDTIYIVNFWATWCKPCVAELPYFNKVSNELSGKKVQFIFVSLDFINTIEKKLKPFLMKNRLEGKVVVLGDQDVNSWGAEIDPKWDGAIPVSMLISKDKKATRLGSFNNETDLMKFINPYILNN